MFSDFSAKAKEARANIRAPEVPMGQILARSAQIQTNSRLRAIFLGGVMSLAMIGTAAAFGTQIFDSVRVWLSGNNGTIVIKSFAMVRYPRESDLQAVVSNATFPVVMPVGLTAGTHVRSLIYAPINHPNMISIQYVNDRTARLEGFTIIDTGTINAGPPPLPGMPLNAARWTIERETVLVSRKILRPSEMTRIKKAMMVTSPRESQTVTKPLLYSATVLGTSPDLSHIALRYTPSSGNSVVIGRHFTDSIAPLAKRGKPLIGSNTTYLTNIPSIHGEPDYAKATLRWPPTVAISSAGVRALAAVLRYAHAGASCDCSVVINHTDSIHYRVWVLHPGSAIKAFRVNAVTLDVARANR